MRWLRKGCTDRHFPGASVGQPALGLMACLQGVAEREGSSLGQALHNLQF